MKQNIRAIYDDGVLRLLQPLQGVSDGQEVVIEVDDASFPETAASLRTRGEWIGTLSAEDAEAMRNAIEQEFEQIDPDDWK